MHEPHFEGHARERAPEPEARMNQIPTTNQQSRAFGQRLRPVAVLVAAAVAVSACVLELPDLPEDQAAGGFGGIIPVPTGGSSGGIGGIAGGGGFSAAGSGGSFAGSAGASCNSGQKLCGDICRPQSVEFGCGAEDCQPCPSLANGSVGCSTASHQCTLLACDDGFADCNGDASVTSDLRASNGCEYSFGALSDPTAPLEVPERTIAVDGNMNDWGEIPAYPLREVCSEAGCADPEFAPISAFATPPLRKDLDAYFRVAWDASFLYLVVEAFDDDIYIDPGTRADEKCQSPADCEESMTLFFDGFDERTPGGSYGASGRRIFLGLQNGLFSRNDDPEADEVGIAGQMNGPACYRIEAQVQWQFLVAQGNPPPGQFPPAVGNTYGFDLSVSDWDTDKLSEPERVRRQSQVFWVNPGPEYRGTMGGFQELRLIDGVPAQQ